MSVLRRWIRQVGWEQRSYWRNPAAASFTFAFPLLLLVVFTAIYGGDRPEISGHRVAFAQIYVPVIIGFGLISACYTNLAFTVSMRRENGLLKRVRGTPLPPGLYFAGMVGNAVVVALILCGLVVALGLVAYGVTFPGHYVAFAVSIVVGAFCFSALGVAVSILVPNEDAAPAIINFILFPLLFISGTFGSVKSGSTLDTISSIFPVRPLNDAFTAVFDPYRHGSTLGWGGLAVMVAWGVGAVAISLWKFRWEPKR